MEARSLSSIEKAGCLDQADVVALAVKALSVLASRRKTPSKRSREERVTELCDAVVNEDPSLHHAVVAQMVAAGISSADVAETYVALAARKLGEAWVDDTLAFSQVTIGAARLQEIVRSLGRTDVSGSVTVPLGHRILLVIPSEEDHTLGAFVAANQFRRYGLWVHLAIRQTADEVAATVASTGLRDDRHFRRRSALARTGSEAGEYRQGALPALRPRCGRRKHV